MSYLKEFQQELRRRQEMAAVQAAQPAPVTKPDPVPSLTDQIKAHMEILPAAVRDRPWSINELVPLLRGKYAEHPHPLHVSRALKALGFRHVRVYRKALGEGVRLWLPAGFELPPIR